MGIQIVIEDKDKAIQYLSQSIKKIWTKKK